MNGKQVLVRRAEVERGWFSVGASYLIRLMAAGWLLVAGADKLSDRFFVNGVVSGFVYGGIDGGLWAVVELAVGVWLLVPWWRSAAVQVALYLFAVFAGVSGYGYGVVGRAAAVLEGGGTRRRRRCWQWIR